MGEMKEIFSILCAIWKIQYSDWQIQHGEQSRGVKNLMKGGITIDRVNNSNVVLDVSQYFNSLLATLFYSMHLLEP